MMSLRSRKLNTDWPSRMRIPYSEFWILNSGFLPAKPAAKPTAAKPARTINLFDAKLGCE
jgi:hypothetical protein